MDFDEESSYSDTSQDSASYGLHGIDFYNSYQYAQFASRFGLGPDFPDGSGHSQPLSQSSLNDIFYNQWLMMAAAFLLWHSVWHTVVCRLMMWMISSVGSISQLNWHFNYPKLVDIFIHICLLLWVYWTVFKKVAQTMAQLLTRRRGPEIDLSDVVASLILYSIGCFICHNIRSVLRVLTRPMVLLLIGLLSLHALGILRWAAVRCKSLFLAGQDKIWLFSMQLRRRCRTSYQIYTRRRSGLFPRSPYKYSKLRASEIRLLELRRTHPLAKLSIRLLATPSPSIKFYEALSYTWGDPTMNHSLPIEGYSLLTTKNAFEALHALAPHWGKRLVWIDSICINQGDDVEKGRQVALMGEIYKQATRTVSWLGGSSNADFAFLQLRRLKRLLAGNHDIKAITRMVEKSSLGPDNVHHWHAVSELLAHPYWSRVWIVQEVAVSRTVDILYGTHCVPLSSVTDIINRLWRAPETDTLLERPWQLGTLEKGMLSNYGNMRAIFEFRRLFQQGQFPPLHGAVQATLLFKATDPRDKIYAFCNIAREPAAAALDPDYTISAQEAFTRFTKRYIQSNFRKLILEAGLAQDRQLPDLPSWVPDFSSTDDLLPPMARTGLHLKDHYAASGGEAISIGIDLSKIIRVQGVYVDQIDFLTSHSIERSLNPMSADYVAPALNAWHEEAIALATAKIPLKYRCGDESRRRAFIRTLIADRDGYGSEAPAVYYRKYYKDWCKYLRTAAEERVELDNNNASDSEEGEHLESARYFSSAVLRVAQIRKFATTTGGFMAIVPKEARVGDIICVLFGMEVPFVLRPVSVEAGEEQTHLLIGWCYCHGIMMGECLETGQASQTFVLR